MKTISTIKFLFTSDVVFLLAFESRLNTTTGTSPSGAVCYHVKMATVDLDVNLTY